MHHVISQLYRFNNCTETITGTLHIHVLTPSARATILSIYMYHAQTAFTPQKYQQKVINRDSAGRSQIKRQFPILFSFYLYLKLTFCSKCQLQMYQI